MCQEKPGPRCWDDTCKTASSFDRRLQKSTEKLVLNKKQLVAAERSKNFSTYTSLRRTRDGLVAKHQEILRDARWNQRDIDGTRRGKALLESQIAMSDNDIEIKGLQQRIAQADALRYARECALKQKKEGRKPLLRIANAA